MLGDRANLLNDLYTAGSCTNDTNLLVTQLNAILWPSSGMVTLPLESLQALERRHVAFCGKAGAEKEVPRSGSAPIFAGDNPLILFLIKLRCRHTSVELTVLADI